MSAVGIRRRLVTGRLALTLPDGYGRDVTSGHDEPRSNSRDARGALRQSHSM